MMKKILKMIRKSAFVFSAIALVFMLNGFESRAAFEAPYYNLKENGGSWNGKKYVLNGEVICNSFFCDGVYTYFLQADGTPMKDRLTYHPDGEHIIYFDERGHEVFDNFVTVKKSIEGNPVNDKCYFNTFGYMYIDVLTYDITGTKLYYANPYGVLECNGFFRFSDGGIGYASPYDATLVKDDFMNNDGLIYYFQSDGHIAKGLISNGVWNFYMDETDGHCIKKELCDPNYDVQGNDYLYAAMAKCMIQDNLKDPTSMIIDSAYAFTRYDGSREIYINYTATNSFGGRLGSYMRITETNEKNDFSYSIVLGENRYLNVKTFDGFSNHDLNKFEYSRYLTADDIINTPTERFTYFRPTYN